MAYDLLGSDEEVKFFLFTAIMILVFISQGIWLWFQHAFAAHSVFQLLISASRLLRNHAWFVFAVDQAFAYAMMSAGSAASGVTNLNRTGIRHSALLNFCKPLHGFCNRVAVSIAFTFFGCFLLAVSAVLHWMPPNLSVPIFDLVDVIFQLQDGGCIRIQHRN